MVIFNSYVKLPEGISHYMPLYSITIQSWDSIESSYDIYNDSIQNPMLTHFLIFLQGGAPVR